MRAPLPQAPSAEVPLPEVPHAWAAPVGRRRRALPAGLRDALGLVAVVLFVWFVIALLGSGG